MKNHRRSSHQRVAKSDKTDSRQNIFARDDTFRDDDTWTSPTRAWPRMPLVLSSPASHPVFLLFLFLSPSPSFPLPPQRPIIVTSAWGIRKIRAATGLVSNEKAVHRPIPTDPPFLVLPNSVNARPPTRWFMLMPIHVENEAVEMERDRSARIRACHTYGCDTDPLVGTAFSP